MQGHQALKSDYKMSIKEVLLLIGLRLLSNSRIFLDCEQLNHSQNLGEVQILFLEL